MSLTTLLSGHDTDVQPAPISGKFGVIAGNMMPGTYEYVITFQTAFGETVASTPVVLSTPTNSMRLTIPLATNLNVYIRNIYRSTVGTTGTQYLLASIRENISTQYVDTTNDSSLSAQQPPTANLARSIEVYDGWLVGTSYSCYGALKCISTGSTITDAFPVTTTRTFTTQTPLGSGVVLPFVAPKYDGMHLFIACDNNITDNDLLVYPFVGQKFRNHAINAPITVTSGFQNEMLYANGEWVLLGRCYIGFSA